MGLSWGYSPKIEKYIPLGDFPADQYLIIAQQAVENLGWKLSHLSESGLIAYTNLSFQSYSEEISIRIVSNFAIFKSECVGIQLLFNDYGKNEQNLDKFFHEFEYVQFQLKDVWAERLTDFHAYISTQDDQYFERSPLAVKDKIKNVFYLFLPQKGYLVTPILLYLNIAFYIVCSAYLSYVFRINLGGDVDAENMRPIMEQAHLRLGVNSRDALLLNNEVWRLLSQQFFHFNFLHLFFNMYALVYIGLMIENKLGSGKTLIVYLLTGICGGLLSIITYKTAFMGGASGSVMGLFGAFLALLLSHAFEKNVSRALLISTLIVVAFMLFNGLIGYNIDNSGHVGGLVFGFILGYLIYNSVFLKQKVGIYLRVTFSVLLVLVLGLVVIKSSPRYQIKEYQALIHEYVENEREFSRLYFLNNEMSATEKLAQVKTYGVDIWKKNLAIVKKMNAMVLIDQDKKDREFRAAIASKGYQLSQLMYQNYQSEERPYRVKIQRGLDEMNKIKMAYRDRLTVGD